MSPTVVAAVVADVVAIRALVQGTA